MNGKLKLIIAAALLCVPLFANADGDEHHYCNPVQKTNLPDPTLIRAEDGSFYLFATEGKQGVPIYKSDNLVDWHFLGTAFDDSTRPTFVTNGHIWAPDINYINGQYVLYYCMSIWGEHWSNGIGVAVSDKVEGPYKDLGKLFLSSEIRVENSIDQFYFEDEDGSKWLFWGSFRGIYAIELSSDGLAVKEGAVKCRVAGSHTEGTCIHKRDGYYYMIGSAGSCCAGEKSTYHLMVARSENLLGPYVDKRGLPALNNNFSELLHKNKSVIGPGHCSEVIEDDAGQTWLMYHGYQADDIKAARVLYMDQVQWDSNGWPYIVGEKPSGEWSRPILSKKPKFTYSNVEYIEYDGDLKGGYVFDTGYVPKEDTRIEVKCRSYSKNKDGEETSIRGNEKAGRWRAVFSSGSSIAEGYSVYFQTRTNRHSSPDDLWSCFGGGYIEEKFVNREDDVDCTFSVSRHSFVMNGTAYPADDSAYAGTVTRLTLFNGFRGNTFCGRIYSLQVYEGDKLVHDYRPCVRNEDKMPMFHDTVTGTYVHPSDPHAFGYGETIKKEKK